jgi:hypothetical protein
MRRWDGHVSIPCSVSPQQSALSRRKHEFDSLGRGSEINDLSALPKRQKRPDQKWTRNKRRWEIVSPSHTNAAVESILQDRIEESRDAEWLIGRAQHLAERTRNRSLRELGTTEQFARCSRPAGCIPLPPVSPRTESPRANVGAFFLRDAKCATRLGRFRCRDLRSLRTRSLCRASITSGPRSCRLPIATGQTRVCRDRLRRLQSRT